MSQVQTNPINIVVNGEPRTAPASLNVEDLLAFLGIEPSRVAVERNRAIVRKAEWNRTTISSGDELEIVQFVGGG
jgi:thiamine biosynthesis protein ThiS